MTGRKFAGVCRAIVVVIVFGWRCRAIWALLHRRVSIEVHALAETAHHHTCIGGVALNTPRRRGATERKFGGGAAINYCLAISCCCARQISTPLTAAWARQENPSLPPTRLVSRSLLFPSLFPLPQTRSQISTEQGALIDCWFPRPTPARANSQSIPHEYMPTALAGRR